MIMSSVPAITVAGLCKSFDGKVVLDGIDLTVAEGTIFALLGPNGAGKTTMVQILSTLIPADSGQIGVAGHDLVADPDGVRAAIGVTGQFSAVDDLLTGEENLRLMADLHHLGRGSGRARVAELLDRFELADAARKQVSTYSGGMRRRLDLAMTLVGTPPLIFLDEPTTGLDLPSRQAMWQVITELAEAGVTIFLTTQYLEEADRLATRVSVLDGGKIVADGTPSALKEQVGGQRLDLVLASAADYDEIGQRLGHRVVRHERATLTLGLATDGSGPEVRALLDQVDPGRTAVRSFAVHAASLDDVFLALTGHCATEPSATEPSATEPSATRPSSLEEESAHV
jgi:ABC-2 type transport system ATP-binding protein